MDLRDIECFLAVSRTLNFTRAAEECRVSQPTLSRAIQRLEREIGGELLVRERGHTHLTALGRLARPELEELANRSRNLRRAAQRQLRLGAADLRLGVMCSIGPRRLGPFLRGFRAARPELEILLGDATPERLAERLLHGEFDLGLAVVPSGFGERLKAEPLYAERFVVACAPSHPFANRPSVALRDLDGQVYLSRINCEHQDVLGAALSAAGARVENGCRSEREDWIQGLAAAGMGICFLPEFSPAMEGLVTCRIEDSPPAREISLLTVAGRRWSPPVAAFVDALRRARWAEA